MGETTRNDASSYEVVIIGAGVCGIYALYRMTQLGVSATVVEKGGDLGGTWFWNRYPGARFDSESYAYGYSFSQELLDEWSWTERYASQPETLQYLNHVADKFDLRKNMQFNCHVTAATFDDRSGRWLVRLGDGRELTCRFLITAVGLLSAPTLPHFEGMDEFAGPSFHTFDWPTDPVDLAGKRVAVIGTGSTGVQVISEIASSVGELTVFQRHPNWCAPLHNSPISPTEMESVRRRYDEIFAVCARTPAGHLHETDPRSYYEVAPAERLALWNRLYDSPGFGIWLSNFRDVYTDEGANRALSDFIADKIRSRVDDPVLAEKLVPKNHGFGLKRVVLETGYFEVYNRDNVHLVDLLETPIERVTENGIETSEGDCEFDVIVYATGFDAVTGAYDRVDIRGVDGLSLRQKWNDGPSTFLGLITAGFPNMLMPVGPQSGSAASNFPRGIEMGVNWVTDLLEYMWKNDYERFDVTPAAEARWQAVITKLYAKLLLRNVDSWFTGYSPNVEGHESGKRRHVIYGGSAKVYRERASELANDGYPGLSFS